MDMAWQIYLYTRRYYHLPPDNFPIGIIVGTFELDARFWYDRNVVGRLLAVTMGVSEEVDAEDGNELYDLYRKACSEVGFDDALCNHYGLPFISWKEYKDKWSDVWTMWKSRICDRLTLPLEETMFVPPEQQPNINRRYGFNPFGTSPRIFWDIFGVNTNKTMVDLDSNETLSALRSSANLTALTNRLVSRAGIVIDLTLPHETQAMAPLVRATHALGFNLIQLRLSSDYSIGFQSETLAHAAPNDQRRRMSINEIESSLVADATRYVSVRFVECDRLSLSSIHSCMLHTEYRHHPRNLSNNKHGRIV